MTHEPMSGTQAQAHGSNLANGRAHAVMAALRCMGATGFDFGSIDGAGGVALWWCEARFKDGVRIISEGHVDPMSAIMDTWHRALIGAVCPNCGRYITPEVLVDPNDADYCGYVVQAGGRVPDAATFHYVTGCGLSLTLSDDDPEPTTESEHDHG